VDDTAVAPLVAVLGRCVPESTTILAYKPNLSSYTFLVKTALQSLSNLVKVRSIELSACLPFSNARCNAPLTSCAYK
jgi:hypothetical protein